jgi:selenoprotein W-related protein
LAAEIEKRYGGKVELIKSDGGVFEVRRDGELIYSKKKMGRFPTTEEIFALLG